MKCVLKNFEPFDKFWFRSCFYQSFLSIAQYFGGDLNKYFANQIYRYEMEDKGHLTVVKENIVRYNYVEGIKEHRRKHVENPIKAIEDKIKKGSPVIIATDCFYIPYRNDVYRTQHGIHYVCIYGFDNTTKRLYVVDHAYWGSYKYEKKEILYSDILRASVFYQKQHPDEFTFYWYSKDGVKKEKVRPKYNDQKLLEDYIEKFKNDLRKNEENFEDYRMFFEGETWLRVPVMNMFSALEINECYTAFNRFINTARMICVILTRHKNKPMDAQTREKLTGYADRFVTDKIAMDDAEARYYATNRS